MPQSTLKKKSQSIYFHLVSEGCAADEWHTTYINTLFNVTDLITKPLSGKKRWYFVRMLLHHILCDVAVIFIRRVLQGVVEH